MQENKIVQVPHPLIHFPFFFVANTPMQGFFYEKPNKFGDLISVQAPQTPRVREMLVFLAALTFVQSAGGEGTTRTEITISEKEWRKAAGFGRTKADKASFREAVEILSKVVYSVDCGGARDKKKYEGVMFQTRKKALPFTKAIFPGLFGDVFFGEGGQITIHVMQDFITDLDQRALRVSLSHILRLRGHIARTLAYIMHGRQAWAGSWEELAELVRIDNWSTKRKQKQALKKALEELDGKGFLVETGDTKIFIKRTERLQCLTNAG